MDQDKLTKFKELVGEEAAAEALADAQLTTKEARAAGIREKEVQEAGEGEEGELTTLASQMAQLEAQLVTFKARVADIAPKGATATNVPASPPVAASAKVAPAEEDVVEEDGLDEGDEESGDEVYIGDMTGPEFVGLLQQALGPMFEQHTKALDLHGKLTAANDSMKEMKSYLGGMTQKDSAVAELKEQVTALGIALKEATNLLTDLTGEVPRELARPQGTAYKASDGVDNVVSPGHPLYQTEATGQEFASPLAWIDSFVVHQQQQADAIQHAAVVQPGQNGRIN